MPFQSYHIGGAWHPYTTTDGSVPWVKLLSPFPSILLGTVIKSSLHSKGQATEIKLHLLMRECLHILFSILFVRKNFLLK